MKKDLLQLMQERYDQRCFDLLNEDKSLTMEQHFFAGYEMGYDQGTKHQPLIKLQKHSRFHDINKIRQLGFDLGHADAVAGKRSKRPKMAEANRLMKQYKYK